MLLVAVLAVVAGPRLSGAGRRLAGRLLSVLSVLGGRRLLAGRLSVLRRLLAAGRSARLAVAVHLLALVAGLVAGAVAALLAAVTVTLPGTQTHTSEGHGRETRRAGRHRAARPNNEKRRSGPVKTSVTGDGDRRNLLKHKIYCKNQTISLQTAG